MITLICGLPNAGKTTYSKKYLNTIHLDDFLKSAKSPKSLYNLCNETAAALDEENVCIQGVYELKKQRMDLLNLIKDKHDKKICIWINTPLQECLKREDRDRSLKMLELIAKYFEPPTYDQGWDQIIEINN